MSAAEDPTFEWDSAKDRANQEKHGVSFVLAQVRFTYREERIRIYSAGYWRRGREIYEEQNDVR